MSKNWDLVPLGNILTERQEKPDMDDLLTGKIPIVEKIAFNEGKIYLRNDGKTKTGMILIRSGDLVLSGINATKGAIAIYPETERIPIAATIHYSSYIVDKNKVDISFLWWLLRSKKFKEILNEYLPGGIKTELKAKRFLPIPIPLPPLEEQKRIVEKIERLAEKIEEVRSLRLQTIKETEALFGSSLSKIICESSSKELTLDKVCLKITDGEHQTPIRIPYKKIPLVTAKNVRDGFLDLGNTDFVENGTAEKCWNRCKPEHNDILMVCVGATTGRVCCVNNPPPIVIVRSVALLRPNQEILMPKFLEYVLKTSYCQTQIWSKVKQAAQPCLYIGRMKTISIPIPPLSEQKRIVEYLDSLQSKIEIMKKEREKALEQTEALLPSILDKAFKGEL